MPAPLAHAAPKSGDKPAAILAVPFVRAAQEHYESFIDVSNQLGVSAVQLGPFDIPAYGFMRGVRLTVKATNGSGTATVVAAEDAPFSAIDECVVMDVNGAPIVGPLSGYDLYLLNKWGGYAPSLPDPKSLPAHQGVQAGANGSGNFAFELRIPIEVNGRDALGALPNQNGASTYKLRVTLAPASKVYGTAPTNLPSVRVTATLDAWTQPTQTDQRGNPNATQPPALGTTSYWSKTVFTVSNGFQTLRLPRVGNYLRELIFVYRDGTGSRAAGAGLFPDPASISWDTRLLKAYPRDLWRNDMARKLGAAATVEAANGLDNGVFVEDYAHEFTGRIGYELRDGWLPTSQSTRLELSGTFTGSGTLTVLTNDVAPNGEIFV